MEHAVTEENGPPRDLSRARVWLLLLLLVAVGAYLRVHGAGAYYYNSDESLHLRIAEGHDVAEVLRFSHYEAHPPMLYILLHYWMALSTRPAFVRGLPLLFGLMAIPLYYRIGTLVADEFTGLCCAGLIAFSQGCIIQSYAVRQYTIFLFFISAAFCYYLLWRQSRSARALNGYRVFAALACLTHFSAIFDVLCIAAFEAFGIVRRRETKFLRAWITGNATIALLAFLVYRLWQPILVPLKSFFATQLPGSFPSLFAHALFYPLVTPGYILPGYMAALLLLIAETGVVITRPAFITNLPGLRSLLALAALAYGLGMLMVLTRIYPEPGTRHSLWALPFVIPPAGWLLSDGARWLAGKAGFSLTAAALVLIVLGIVTCNPAARFDDGSEYTWKRDQWKSFSTFMNTLGPRDLIVTEKDDGIMLANLYRSMGSDAFTGRAMAELAPYRDTHILFNPYYPRHYSTDIFLATLAEARDRHMLDGIDRLVFLRMTWSRSPLTDLMLCPALAGEITTFPPGSKTRDGLAAARAAVMIIPKQELLEDILPPDGRARACLRGMHDMVPGLRHGAP